MVQKLNLFPRSWQSEREIMAVNSQPLVKKYWSSLVTCLLSNIVDSQPWGSKRSTTSIFELFIHQHACIFSLSRYGATSTCLCGLWLTAVWSWYTLGGLITKMVIPKINCIQVIHIVTAWVGSGGPLFAPVRVTPTELGCQAPPLAPHVTRAPSIPKHSLSLHSLKPPLSL